MQAVKGSQVNLADVVLRFGKHKGKALKEVPMSYLSWVASRMPDEGIGVLVQRYINIGQPTHEQPLQTRTIQNVDEKNLKMFSTAVISKLGSSGQVDQAKAVFDGIPSPDAPAWNAMITCYGQNGLVVEARHCFDTMSCEKTRLSWFAMFGAYTRKNLVNQADELFQQMPQRDHIVWITLLRLHSPLLAESTRIFYMMPFHDLTSATLMLSTFANHKCLEDARNLFDRMPEKDGVCWNALLAAYAKSHVEFHARAQEVFKLVPQWSQSVFLSMMEMCSAASDAEKLFHLMPEHDVLSWIKLLDVAARAGDMAQADRLFRLMPASGIASWTIMLRGYAAADMMSDVRRIFQGMPERDTQAYSVFLVACVAESSDVSEKTIASQMEMLGECTASWTALLAAYAEEGHLLRALEVFHRMQLLGVNADDVSLLCLLQVCSHNAEVKSGRLLFMRMKMDFGVAADRRHFCCMVDLLGRAGHLDEAEELISEMPFIPTAAEWSALLGACRSHKREPSARAERAAKELMRLSNEASYVLLGNVYANREAEPFATTYLEPLRNTMRAQGLRAKLGVSTISIGGKLHKFVAGDCKDDPDINAELRRLSNLLEQVGYKPKTEASFSGSDELEKRELLCRHSEKLALAFGFLSSKRSEDTISIKKNLRMCHDCHDATRVLSGLVKRRIVVRDANRTHRFDNGMCSCGDYW